MCPAMPCLSVAVVTLLWCMQSLLAVGVCAGSTLCFILNDKFLATCIEVIAFDPQ